MDKNIERERLEKEFEKAQRIAQEAYHKIEEPALEKLREGLKILNQKVCKNCGAVIDDD